LQLKIARIPLNGLFDAMKRGKGRVVLGFVLKELIDYTAYHFSTEDKKFGPFLKSGDVA
jgi:hemerythrin